MTTKLLPIPLALALLIAASPASAADAASDAAAEALFAEAKALDKAGDTRGALAKFLEAQRLSASVGTLLNIGDCYERLGQLASAWGAFKSAELMARTAGDAAREAEALRRADALALRLAKLAINVPPAARVPGFELRRDGIVIGEGQWGSALPVDAGLHTIEASAPGRQKWTMTVNVAAGGASVAVSVPELPLEKTADEKPLATPAWGAQRIAGLAVGGVGVAGVIIGAVFGARAISKNNDSKAQCSPADPNFCNDRGVALRGEAKTAGTISSAAIVAGGVLAAGGVVLVLTAPSAKAKDKRAARFELMPRVGGGELGMTIGARW